MEVIHCTNAHIDILSKLFNEYRIFYQQPSDVTSCRAFILQNLQQHRSKIFLLLDDQGQSFGFSQLYPSVCSISMRPYYYLSDLYIIQCARKKGYGRYLMKHISDHFTNQGVQRLTLDTGPRIR